MSVSITIKGFKNKVEAIEFMNWYSNQGEQDIVDWMEYRQQEGKDVREYMNCISIDKENLVMDVSE